MKRVRPCGSNCSEIVVKPRTSVNITVISRCLAAELQQLAGFRATPLDLIGREVEGEGAADLAPLALRAHEAD